jgi:predicted Ser/Thr protein kinase
VSGDNLGLIGQTLGEYQIHAELGRGGMAVVYKGYDPSLERWVAIKTLPQESSGDRDLVSRFGREAKAMGALNHTNIVQIIGSGVDRGLHYFVMEFVEGPSLQDLLKQEQLSMDLMFDIATQVCDGLEYAHKKGIVHRDIKPGNVLYEAGTGLAKIADFGIARLTHKPEEMITLTATNVGMGTVNYMAPEQKTDAANVDHRADIYSLGVVVYEMFTGRLPMGRFKLPSQLNSKLPRGLDEIVTRSLEPDPVDRYGAMSELRAGLVSAQASAGGGTLIRSVRDAAERTLTAMVGGGGSKVAALLGCFVLLGGLAGGGYAVKRFVIDAEQVATKTEDPPAKTEDPPAKTEDPPAKTEDPPAKTEDPPAKTEDPPAKTEDPPAKTEAPPAKTEDPPAKTEDPPAKTEDPPAKTEDPPAKTEDPPAKTEDPPAKTEDTPAKTEDPPAKTEDPPAKTEDPPAKTEDPPAKTEDPPAKTEDPPAKTEDPVEPKETPIAAVDAEVAKRAEKIRRERSELERQIGVWKRIASPWLGSKTFAAAKADLVQQGQDAATLTRLESANRDLPPHVAGALKQLLERRLKSLSELTELPELAAWADQQLLTLKGEATGGLDPKAQARRTILYLQESQSQEVTARRAQAASALRLARTRVSKTELAPVLQRFRVAEKDIAAGDLKAAAQALRTAHASAMALVPKPPLALAPRYMRSVSSVWPGIFQVTAISAVGGSGPETSGDRFVAIGYRQRSKTRALLVGDCQGPAIAGRDPVDLGEHAFTVAVEGVENDRSFSCYVGEQDVTGFEAPRIRKLNVNFAGQVHPSELKKRPYLEFPKSAGRLHDLAVMHDGTLAVLLSEEVLLYRGTRRIRQIPLRSGQGGLSTDTSKKVRQIGVLRLPRRIVALADGTLIISGLKPAGNATWFFESRAINGRISAQWQFSVTVIPPPGAGEVQIHEVEGRRPSPSALIPVAGGVVGVDHGANPKRLMTNLKKWGRPKANFFRQTKGRLAPLDVLIPGSQTPYLALDGIVTGKSFVVLGLGSPTSHLGGDLESYLRAWDPEGRNMLYVYQSSGGGR